MHHAAQPYAFRQTGHSKDSELIFAVTALQGGHALYSACRGWSFQLSTDASHVLQTAMCCLPAAHILARCAGWAPCSACPSATAKQGRVLDLWDHVSELWASLLCHVFSQHSTATCWTQLRWSCRVRPAGRGSGGDRSQGAGCGQQLCEAVLTAALPRYAVPTSAGC